VNRGDRTTAYAIALGLMPVAEHAWAVALPGQLVGLAIEQFTPSRALQERLEAS
jgi:hypothetical protein